MPEVDHSENFYDDPLAYLGENLATKAPEKIRSQDLLEITAKVYLQPATGMVYDYNHDNIFLENGTLPQAAYLVLLEAAGVLNEATFGPEIWNSPGMLRVRERLQEPDAQNFRYHILGFDQRQTPLALVYLQGRGIHTTTELQEAARMLPSEMDLAGIVDEVNLINAQLNLFFSQMQKDLQSPEFYAEESLDFLLDETLDIEKIALSSEMQKQVDELNTLANQLGDLPPG